MHHIQWIYPVIRGRDYMSWKPITLFTAWYDYPRHTITTLGPNSLLVQTMIRKSYVQSIRNIPSTIPSHHISHCFDSLRQHIQCTAPDNLLYTYGNHSSGDGQVRQCRDWHYLHQWTVAHSTCNPVTDDAEPILSHYKLCNGDSDGLPTNTNSEKR